MNCDILLVEDDEDFGYMLKQYLELSGMRVLWKTNPHDVEDMLDSDFFFHVAIFDVMMPYMSGFDLARKVAEKYPKFPFLFLTAKDQKVDKLTGLKLGAWDYVTKPCDPEELVLRIQNIVSHRLPAAKDQPILIGEYIFNRSRQILTHEKESYRLTEREAELLYFLWESNGKLVTREQVLEQVWGSVDFFTGRSMDVFISRLRKYLAMDRRLKINSVRGVGFEVKF